MPLFFFILLFAHTFSYTINPHIIIIPGTWSSHSAWHKPCGDFFEALRTAAQGRCSQVHTFIWSGKNNHYHRVKAAQSLAQEIEKFNEVIIVAHSHGVNVGNLASQELSQKKSKAKIKICYALGTPVNADEYAPDMSIIDYFYNLFSFGDVVQPVFGAFERVYPSHERIANVSVTINGKEPSHCELHDTTMARWLPMLHDHLTHNPKISFDFTLPCIVHFTQEQAPRYEFDEYRMQALEQDKKFQREFARAFDRRPRIDTEDAYDESN